VAATNFRKKFKKNSTVIVVMGEFLVSKIEMK
jgi:hypothetical protein